ncbi:MAG: FlgD immunoglobulin-like domain containing protein [Candidatus Cloacimonas sp.]|nr:FlgD immunoglobulin-like domain containing protein [Candidatus Cloacimonas sp.]
MKKLLLPLLLLMVLGLINAQTTVFSDDFSTNQNATWTTSGAIGASAFTVNRSGADWGARRNTSPAQLELTNDASGTANVLGWVFANTATSGFSSPYNTTLSSNSGLVTWTLNIRQIRTDPAGYASGSYGAAFILATTSQSANNTGTGYAIVYGQSGTTDPIRLARYSGGLLTGLTDIITSNTTGLTDFGTDYISCKVTYNPSNNTWELFLRNDGTSAFTDPTTGSLVSQGTAVDNTYTSTALAYMGGYWQGSTSANLTAFFDNVKVTVVSGGVSAPTTQASSLTFSSIGQNGMTVNWTNGNGAKRIVIMNTSNSFTNPTDATDPTANTVYGGSGQQVVYNNSSNTVPVTGLSASTTYWYRVYEYNGSGASTKYITSTATDNPKSQATTAPTPTITTGAVTTPPFYVDSATTATGSVPYTSIGTYSGATFTAKLSDASGSFASPTSIGTASVSGTNPSGSVTITIPTGTTEGTGYKIRIDSDSPAVTGTESSAFTIQNGAKNVTGASSTVASGSLAVTWTNPTSIYDEVMIVVKAISTISGTPTGNGSAYSASLSFGSGTGFDSGFVVYKGATSPQTITNLSNGTIYYAKIYTRKNSNWSAGVEISNTPMAQPTLTDIIVPQYMQGLSGTNNNRIPTAMRLKLENLTPSSTYRYACQFVLSTSIPTYDGAGTPVYVMPDGSFVRTTSPGLSTAGSYGEFTTDATGLYEGWFMGEPTGNTTVFPVGNEVFLRLRLNGGNNGTSVVTRLTTTSPIKVINFGTEENVNQGTFLYGVSLSPAKNFAFVYDNEAGTGRPIAGSVIESDGLDLSGVSSILSAYLSNVDAVAGAWGVIIPNSIGTKGFTGIKRVESRRLDDGTIYAENTDSNGVWPSGANTVNPTGGSATPIVLGAGDATLPVELSSFTATLNAYNNVSLMWVTQSETGVNGFYVHRGVSSDLSQALIVSPLIVATNTSQQQSYLFTDSELNEDGIYYYWLQAQDLDGGVAYHGPITITYSGGGNPGTPNIPLVTEFNGIYPNPFNPNATLSYGLAKQGEVNFAIYNTRGQLVRSFSEGTKAAGNYKTYWNGTDNNGRICSTGVYYIRMISGQDSFMRKAVLMK